MSLSLGYVDEIGYQDRKSNLQNSSLVFSGLFYKIDDALNVDSPLQVILPTNQDDRRYLSFRGSIIAMPTLSWTTPVQGLSLKARFTTALKYFEFESSKGGIYNNTQSYGLSLIAGYKWKKFMGSLGFSNYSDFLADGSKKDDTYLLRATVSYKQNENISYSVSWFNRDRTFGYDGVTPNIGLSYADKSVVTTAVTYSL